MKKLIIIAAIFIACSASAIAQTAGYINTETILSRIPEYNQAQQQLERMKAQYDTQIQNEVKIIENMYNQYQIEKARLNDIQRQAKENEIILKERAVKQRQQDIFGPEGTMASKTKELLDPIKDFVQKAIDEVAKETGTTLIFDVASTQGIIYTDPKADLTQKVIAKLMLN
jgi:outer membrane protein